MRVQVGHVMGIPVLLDMSLKEIQFRDGSTDRLLASFKADEKNAARLGKAFGKRSGEILRHTSGWDGQDAAN